MGDASAPRLGPPAVALLRSNRETGRPSAERYEVDLRRADEIVLRQPADGVGGERHAAVVVADLQVRVMVLDVGHVGEGVDEAHGAVEVTEGELAADGV